MGSYASTVIAIAMAEVGYVEKASNKNLDSQKANAGSGNYTKYGRDMHALYPAVMDFPAAWCDCFVDWCFYKAFGTANAKALLGGDFNDYTVASAQLYKNKNRWYTSSPKVGDQIFFKNSSRICHTGLVYKVDSTTVYTIEGNTSSADFDADGGAVCSKSYSLKSTRIAGYGRPNYDAEPIVNTFTNYKVKCTSNLNVRDCANSGSDSHILGVLNKGHEFTIRGENNGWGKVCVVCDSNKKTVNGWVSLKYTQKI